MRKSSPTRSAPAAPRRPASSHDVLRGFIALVLVLIAVFIAAVIHIGGSPAAALLVLIGGVMVGGVVWRPRS